MKIKVIRGSMILTAFLLVVHYAHASVSRIQSADSLISSDATKSYSLPAATDTLIGRVSTDTLTNKSISGSTNTLSNLPIGGQISQVIAYGNGSTTSYTLSPTPPANSAVSLYLDGLVQSQGTGLDYTISGSSVTFAAAPVSGQVIYAIYSRY